MVLARYSGWALTLFSHDFFVEASSSFVVTHLKIVGCRAKRDPLNSVITGHKDAMSFAQCYFDCRTYSGYIILTTYHFTES